MRIKDIKPEAISEAVPSAELKDQVSPSLSEDKEIADTMRELRELDLKKFGAFPSQKIGAQNRNNEILQTEYKNNQSFLMQRGFEFALATLKSEKQMSGIRERAKAEKRNVSEALFIEAFEMVKLGWKIGKERLVVK